LFAIQIARHIVSETGRVVTSCSSRNIELVKKHGADEAIDYTSVDLPAYLSQTYSNARFDLVLDCVGSFELYNASPGFLNPTGDFVLIGIDVPQSFREFLTLAYNLAFAMLLPTFLGGVPRRFKVSLIKVTKEHIEAVGNLVQSRVIVPVLDSTWKFDDNGIKGAYAKIMTRHARGKVVIKIVK
jgi:reticulon-4-interacting protein 1, mitochondrial